MHERLKQRALQAAEEALYKQQYVSPIDLFIGMKLLQPVHVEDWKKGRIPYLERVIQGSLGKITFQNTRAIAAAANHNITCEILICSGLRGSPTYQK